MANELREAHPLLKAQWPGRVLQLTRVGGKSFPDFTLTHDGRIAFVEVKAAGYYAKINDLKPGQADELDRLHADGLCARLLVYIPADARASLSSPGWGLFVPPMKRHSRILRTMEADRFTYALTPEFIFGLS